MEFTEMQWAMLSGMTQPQQQAIRAWLNPNMSLEARLEEGDSRVNQTVNVARISLDVFVRIVDQVIGFGDLTHAKREQIRKGWEQTGGAWEGLTVWQAASAADCKVSQVLSLFDWWGSVEADPGVLPGASGTDDQARETIIREALKQGAGRTLIQKWFGCSDADYLRFHQRVVETYDLSGFRTRMLDEDEDTVFYQDWKAAGSPVEWEALLQLAEQSGYPLAIIWPLIEEWHETELALAKLKQGRVKGS